MDYLVMDVGIIFFYLLVEKMCICLYVCIIVNIVSSWFIELHRQYDYFMGKENVYVCICGYYCKYFDEFCYKAPLNTMIVISSTVVIVNTATRCVIKLHG